MLGIATRMLSKELKDMELNRTITRTVHPGSPVKVEYESTVYCKTFGLILVEIINRFIEHWRFITGKADPYATGTS